MINIKDFDSNLLKIDKTLHRNIDIYYTGYLTLKNSDYIKINSVNALYLIIDKVDKYIEEKNRNKNLTFASTDKTQEVLIKYKELWNEIKYLIKAINGGQVGEYRKDYLKIKFISDDNLLLNKILKIDNLTTVVRSAFQE